MELVTKMSVNTSAVPLTSTKPMLDGRIVGGTETDITSHPYQVWPLCCCSVWRYFEVFVHKKTHVFVMIKRYSSKRIKKETLEKYDSCCV